MPKPRKKRRVNKKKFAASLQPCTFYDKSRRITIKGTTDGPIQKTDQCWVPAKVAAMLFDCSHQTIRLLHIDGKVKAVQYPNTTMLFWLPDVAFYAIDDDDRFCMDLDHHD